MSLRFLVTAVSAFILAFAARLAPAQSTLSPESSAELQRLLRVETSKKAVINNMGRYTLNDLMILDSFQSTPKSSLDRLLLWHDIALDTTALDHTPVTNNAGADPRRFGEQLGPHKSSRAMALVHIAMFDSLVAISKKFKSFTSTQGPVGPASEDAAIAQSAHDILVWLYPSHQIRLDDLRNRDFSQIHGDPNGISAGQKLGQLVAANLIAMRRDDHADITEPTVSNIQPPLKAGQWTKDPLNDPAVALGGYWSKVTPFVIKSADAFRAPEPPFGNSAASLAYDEAMKYGGDPNASPKTAGDMRFSTDTVRTESQTFSGIFWAYDGTPALCAPPRLYNEIVVQVALSRGVADVNDMARLLVLANTAMADAGISAWEAKYHYLLQRPVTAIRFGDGKRYPNAKPDPKWTPLGAPVSNGTSTNFTPPFPSYPSGHATFGGAVFEILRRYFNVTSGTDTSFTFTSDEFNGQNYAPGQSKPRPNLPMSFVSFEDAEYQNALSRVYLGIHWRFDADAGIKQGNAVGQYVFLNAFTTIK